MSTVVTVRDVPDEVRDLLAQQARERGQSLQAYLLGVLRRQAAFSRNRQMLAEIGSELNGGDGAGPDAPDAADVLAQERAERRQDGFPQASA
jgi:hypothetical protein